MCFCWKNKHSGKRFFVNCISDPRESSSIKLTQLMVGLVEEELAFELDYREEYFEIEATVLKSLDAWYGNNMPKIYLTEKGKDLVMNVYIYEDHAEALMKFERPVLKAFFWATQITIHKRILDVLNQPNYLAKLAQFKCGPCGKYRKTGAKAKFDDIHLYLFGAPGAPGKRQESPGSSFKVGDNLFTFGMIDKSLKRSVYYNIIVDDKPESITMPPEFIKLTESSLVQYRREVGSGSTEEIDRILFRHLVGCFSKLYANTGPAIYVGKDNDKNLIISIPLHVDHVPPIMQRLIAFWRSSLYNFIVNFHRFYYLKDSRRDDLKVNTDFDFIPGELEYQAIGRRATNEEIYSLILKKKRTSTSSAARPPNYYNPSFMTPLQRCLFNSYVADDD